MDARDRQDATVTRSVGEQIIQAARAYRGCKFHHLGRVRAGMDCIGLLVLVAKDVGIPIQDVKVYSRRPNPEQLMTHIRQQLDPVPKRYAEDGDVLVFCMKPGKPQHVGFKAGPNLIHTNAKMNRVSEHLFDGYWQDRLHSVWRFRT